MDTEQTDGEIVIRDAEMHSSGRITIPARKRERYDIGEDDIVDVMVDAPRGVCIALDVHVDSQGRVRIPSRKRDLYGLSDDAEYYVEMQPGGPDDTE
jgi:bifunctional DNA-binding transcriptional regulator/antitoxin component of YhaV-PrlF toxin-antitoxin module